MDRTGNGTVGYQGAFAKRLLLHEGWIYAPGGTWWRIHSRTFEAERLVPLRLPQPYHRLNRFVVSAHLGLIGWGDLGSIFRVSVVDKEE